MTKIEKTIIESYIKVKTGVDTACTYLFGGSNLAYPLHWEKGVLRSGCNEVGFKIEASKIDEKSFEVDWYCSSRGWNNSEVVSFDDALKCFYKLQEDKSFLKEVRGLPLWEQQKLYGMYSLNEDYKKAIEKERVTHKIIKEKLF